MNSNVVDPRKRATFDCVVEAMLGGATVTAASKQAGITHHQFYQLLCSERELSEAYARAMEMRADIWADETIAIADTDTDAARARNRINARQWGAAKTYSKKYGDRVDLNITQQISADAALTAAAQRLRPVRDQRDVIDVEVHMQQRPDTHGASDKQSVVPLPAAQPDGEPDIFS